MVFTLGLLLSLIGCSDGESARDGSYYGPGNGNPNYGTSDAYSSSDSYGGEPVDPPSQSGENYATYLENEFVDPSEDSLATFSMDVDTGSYTIMRRDLAVGRLPVPASVRVEEYINFFRYPYEPPDVDAEHPFALHLQTAPSRFGEDLSLLRVGVKGFEISEDERKSANLVFLIDVSGSMQSPDKLGLIKTSLYTLLDSLRLSDTVGIVVYAGRDAVLLRPTSLERRSEIKAAIERLSAGGSTAGASGLRTAYELAEDGFVEGGINRIMLCTDGDFNVGIQGEALLEKIEEQRDRGITISTFGFGAGNYNDHLIEQISNRGNGNYSYIDSQAEAERLFGRDLTSILQVIAKDVKVQVDFNPEVVARYRLVGYDNRVLEDDEFDDDTVDAAEVGAGHNATAFLEFELKDSAAEAAGDVLLAEVRLRYKQPDGDVSEEYIEEVTLSDVLAEFDDADVSFRFAAAVTEYAEILHHSKHSAGDDFDGVLSVLAGTTDASIPDSGEFMELVTKARQIWNRASDGW